GCDYEIGCTGTPTFFYKHYEGDLELSESCGPFVFDVVNDHFAGRLGWHYRDMCARADAIAVSSPVMREIVKKETGRDATVIDDPYENEEHEPRIRDNRVLWFGHSANLGSLFSSWHVSTNMPPVLTVCSNNLVAADN